MRGNSTLAKEMQYEGFHPFTPEYWDARARQAVNDEAMVGWHGAPYTMQREYIESLLGSFVQWGKNVLDVGCGFGRFAECIRANGGNWYGLDFSTEMLLQFSSRHYWPEAPPAERFMRRNAADGPEGTRKYRLIFCVGGYRTCGFPTVEAFEKVYAPFIERPGHIVLVECHETIVRNYW